MPLSDYRDDLKKLYAARIAHASADPRQVLFCRSLRYLIEHAEDFDRVVPEDDRFYREFTGFLEKGFTSEEDCFSLFECMVILFRMCQCARGGETSPLARDLLRYFEECGEWRPNDGTLVSEWYWRRIPGAAASRG